MALLDPARKRIQEWKERREQKKQERKEKDLERAAKNLWEDIRGQINEGDFQSSEDEIREFIEQNSLDHMSTEEIEELVYLQMLEYERERMREMDEDIFKGDTSDHYMEPNPKEKQDEPLFTIKEVDEEYRLEWMDVKLEHPDHYVTLSHANNLLEETRVHRQRFQFIYRLGKEMDMPGEMIEPAKYFLRYMEERAKVIEEAAELLSQGQERAAKEGWESLMQMVDEEEREIGD